LSFLLFEIPNCNAEEALPLKRIFLFPPSCFREMYNAVVFVPSPGSITQPDGQFA